MSTVTIAGGADYFAVGVVAASRGAARKPELTPSVLPDTGCWASPSCLSCPLPRCRYEMLPAEVIVWKRRLLPERATDAPADRAPAPTPAPAASASPILGAMDQLVTALTARPGMMQRVWGIAEGDVRSPHPNRTRRSARKPSAQ